MDNRRRWPEALFCMKVSPWVSSLPESIPGLSGSKCKRLSETVSAGTTYGGFPFFPIRRKSASFSWFTMGNEVLVMEFAHADEGDTLKTFIARFAFILACVRY